jgi:hypothetical protein
VNALIELRAAAIAELSPPDFSEHARRVLEESRIWERIELRDVIRALERGELPPGIDVDADFEHAPGSGVAGELTVELRVRTTYISPIHDHLSEGAFAVLSGSMLVARYNFREEREPFGTLELTGLERLSRGAIERVNGPHAIAHLEKPTAIVAIKRRMEGAVSRIYRAPGLALLAHRPANLSKRTRLLNVLAKAGHPEHLALLEEIVAGPSSSEAAIALEQAFWFCRDDDAFERWLSRMPMLERVLEEDHRAQILRDLYRRTKDVERRVELAASLFTGWR